MEKTIKKILIGVTVGTITGILVWYITQALKPKPIPPVKPKWEINIEIK